MESIKIEINKCNNLLYFDELAEKVLNEVSKNSIYYGPRTKEGVVGSIKNLLYGDEGCLRDIYKGFNNFEILTNNTTLGISKSGRL